MEPKPTINRTAEYTWRYGDQAILRERDDGRYDITNWHALNHAELAKVHAVIGEVLQATQELVITQPGQPPLVVSDI